MKNHPEIKELPRIKELSAEYSQILERKKANYSEYKKLKRESKDWIVADQIVQMILEEEKKEREQDQTRKDLVTR